MAPGSRSPAEPTRGSLLRAPAGAPPPGSPVDAGPEAAVAFSHAFDEGNPAGERGTRWVIAITAAMMVVEIAAGWWFNSMALLADGWHMASHTAAIGLSATAYVAARRLSSDSRFAFGTWKIEALAGFASAVLLVGVAALMAVSSVSRLVAPQRIMYAEAIPIAVIGLAVNVVCAIVLARAEAAGHPSDSGLAGERHRRRAAGPDAGAHHHHHDLNLRAAYLHVATDAATSVLAVVALSVGLLTRWTWLDAVMGLVGAAVVGRWGWGLIGDAARVLLDREMDHPIVGEIRDAIATRASWSPTTRLVDLHVWRVGRRRFACALGLVTDAASLTPTDVKRALVGLESLAHVTVEINHAVSGAAVAAKGDHDVARN